MNEAPTQTGPKPPCYRVDALAVLMRLRQAGHVAYFAGGCVRDELLGITPKDYDVATDAPPNVVRALFSNTQAVGAAFGVILVRHGGSVIEVATFRSDGAYLDGRRPSEVHFTTAEVDARRRDFTINGLFLDPANRQVIDYVGGQADIKARVIRAIGDPRDRFAEDHLRMLRAVRFAARFGFDIAAETLQAIRDHAARLTQISPERIADELRAMLRPISRGAAYRLLRETRLLPVILRYLPERPAADATAISPADLFLSMNDAGSPAEISFGAALAAIALQHRIDATGQEDLLRLMSPAEVRRVTQAMRQTLKLSNEETDELIGVLSVGHLLEDAPPTVAKLKRFLATPTSAEARLLLRGLARCAMLADRISPLLERLDELDGQEVAPPPLVTGDDLVAAGLRPGPLFKRVLDEVYDAQLEQRVATRERALEMALQIAKSG